MGRGLRKAGVFMTIGDFSHLLLLPCGAQTGSVCFQEPNRGMAVIQGGSVMGLDRQSGGEEGSDLSSMCQ